MDVTTTVVVAADGKQVGLTGAAAPSPLGDVATVAVECCEDTPPDRDPVLLLASGEMPEQRRRDRSPIESWRSLSRSLSAWLSSTVCVGVALFPSGCCCCCCFIPYPSGSGRGNRLRSYRFTLESQMNEGETKEEEEDGQRASSAPETFPSLLFFVYRRGRIIIAGSMRD